MSAMYSLTGPFNTTHRDSISQVYRLCVCVRLINRAWMNTDFDRTLFLWNFLSVQWTNCLQTLEREHLTHDNVRIIYEKCYYYHQFNSTRRMFLIQTFALIERRLLLYFLAHPSTTRFITFCVNRTISKEQYWPRYLFISNLTNAYIASSHFVIISTNKNTHFTSYRFIYIILWLANIVVITANTVKSTDQTYDNCVR